MKWEILKLKLWYKNLITWMNPSYKFIDQKLVTERFV